MVRKILAFIFKGFALWRKVNNHFSLMEILRIRIIFSIVCSSMIFACIIYRIADLMIIGNKDSATKPIIPNESPVKRADIVDRNGILLATNIMTYSCFADPSAVLDINETVQKLSNIPEMPTRTKLNKKLIDKNKHFIWLARHITPEIQEKIMDLGLPGIALKKDYKRIYIHGPLFSHVIGCTDTDGNGVCGLEKKFDKSLVVYNDKKLILSLDLRLQSIIYEELQKGIEKFNAIGGNAIFMSINGEVLTMVSLPDFDGNNIVDAKTLFNRNTLAVFEPGSTFKILNVAIALDSRSATLGSMFDASNPIKFGRHMISDFKGKGRALSLAEAFVFSSNIASVKIAQNFGMDVQKAYLKRFGIMDKVSFEIPEIGAPIIPTYWTESTSMTVAYGYGIALSPLQILSTITSIVNDGRKVYPTLLYGNTKGPGEQIVSSETSAIVRDLMRAVILYGTGKKAGIDEVEIFGKTGTAYKSSKKGYGSDGSRTRITTFIGGFPKDSPKYMLILMLDEPKAVEGTFGYATAGWNVAPIAQNIFKRITPLLSNGEEKHETKLSSIKYINLN
ncbi:MAG: penicillin-binding protein 2 [Holosporales bacterium]|jgi:cell division protein FtsI (penicillin-binding protein 3)|nr:penicillin-binding protein 2 [Holosporales bacterium]